LGKTWKRDLTADGDVEKNPGPANEDDENAF
jgi:hypothetical protein